MAWQLPRKVWILPCVGLLVVWSFVMSSKVAEESGVELGTPAGDHTALAPSHGQQRVPIHMPPLPGGRVSVPKDGRLVIVGDIHGCLDELEDLLAAVDFRWGADVLVHVGDLVAKGPKSEGVLRFCHEHSVQGVQGNHEHAVLRRVRRLREGATFADINDGGEHAALAATLAPELLEYIEDLPMFLRVENALADGRDVLIVHAGMLPGVQPRDMGSNDMANMRDILKDGSATHVNDGGTPWFSKWDGPELVVYGHNAIRGLLVRETSVGLDSGCCYGGSLSAYILPEGRIVQVKARQVWSKPTRKLASTTAPAAATGCTGEPAAKVCEASGAVEESKDADAGCPTVVGKK